MARVAGAFQVLRIVAKGLSRVVRCDAFLLMSSFVLNRFMVSIKC